MREHPGQRIIDACLAMGFACAGIAPAAPSSRGAEFRAWIASGKHGDMRFMSEHVEDRLDVTGLLPGARSVIVVADQYAARGDIDPDPDARSGRIARYARGRDYHTQIKARLHDLCDRLRENHRGAEFRTFVDTGPAMEREHAARAAMGGAFIGRHTLLIHPRLGSWLLLGGVATTLDLAREGPLRSEPDHCGTCTRCIDACPTEAIARSGWSVDATRCISYLTLEHRGEIDPELHASMGDRLIGCDVCQEVCPFNQPHDPAEARGGDRARVNPAYFDESGVRARLPILEVLGWSEQDRSHALSRSAAKRASLEMIKRNAVIVAANTFRTSLDPALLKAIRASRDDESESHLVRATAGRVLESLGDVQG